MAWTRLQREHKALSQRHAIVLDEFAALLVRYIRLDSDYRDTVERNEDLVQRIQHAIRRGDERQPIKPSKPIKARDVVIH